MIEGWVDGHLGVIATGLGDGLDSLRRLMPIAEGNHRLDILSNGVRVRRLVKRRKKRSRNLNETKKLVLGFFIYKRHLDIGGNMKPVGESDKFHLYIT